MGGAWVGRRQVGEAWGYRRRAGRAGFSPCYDMGKIIIAGILLKPGPLPMIVGDYEKHPEISIGS